MAILLGVVGFAAGAAGSAWQTREARAEPWRKLRVEHQGLEGTATRTRVVFDNPKLPIQAIELSRSSEGTPEVARVSLGEGEELTIRYDDDARPASVEAADGSRANLSYAKKSAHVSFVGGEGQEVGGDDVTVPPELRPVLRLSRSEEAPASEAFGGLLDGGAPFVRDAHAQASQDAEEALTVQRDVELRLQTRLVGSADAGTADVEASCPPLSCVVATPTLSTPGEGSVRITVGGSVKRASLRSPGDDDLGELEREAKKERAVARRVLPDVAGVVAALGVVASACKSVGVTGTVCVVGLRKNGSSAGGAIRSITSHEVAASGPILRQRAEALYLDEQARAALDKPLDIEVCVQRDGYARACVKLGGRPLGPEPMAVEARSLELRRGIGDALAGSFELSQADGADCKFSPSPKTKGPLRLAFDEERGTITASLRSSERGARANLGCSLGTANMSWSQSYNVTATQTATARELASGGKLALRLTGTMSGSGSFSFSNCRSGGGVSANCPPGKNESYAYPVELLGELDLDKQTGSGRIVVSGAPLVTQGTWRIPAESAR